MNTLSEETAKRALKILAEAYAREVCGLEVEVTIVKNDRSDGANIETVW